MTTTPTLEQLKRGIAIFQQIESLHQELASVLGTHSAPVAKAASAPAQGDGRTGKRSAATIAKMKASQQARWAKVKTPAVAPSSPKAPVKKGGMSAAGRAAIVAAQKARWAKIKGEAAKSPAKAPAASKAPANSKAEAPAKKRNISPEARAKMAAAAKARWAAAKAGKGPAPTASKKK